MSLHDLIVAEFEHTKSLAALIYLIDNGRELEFSYEGKTYFISCDRSQKYVSLWDGQNEQSFDNVEELIEAAVISDTSFLSALPEIRIDAIF